MKVCRHASLLLLCVCTADMTDFPHIPDNIPMHHVQFFSTMLYGNLIMFLKHFLKKGGQLKQFFVSNLTNNFEQSYQEKIMIVQHHCAISRYIDFNRIVFFQLESVNSDNESSNNMCENDCSFNQGRVGCSHVISSDYILLFESSTVDHLNFQFFVISRCD